MQECNLRVYAVGHGLCTLLYGVTDAGNKYCAVFDCGTTQAFCNVAVDGILDDMCAVIRECGELNLLVCSHQDEDHNSGIMRLICKLNGWNAYDMRDKWFRISPDGKGKVNGSEVTKLFINGNGVICCIKNDESEKYCLEINCLEDGTAETNSVVLVWAALVGRSDVPLDVRLLFNCRYAGGSAQVSIEAGSTVQIDVDSVLAEKFKGYEDQYRREYPIERDLPQNQMVDQLVEFLTDYIWNVFEEEADTRTKNSMKRRIGLTEQIYRRYQDYKRELERDTVYEVVMPVWNVILGGGEALPRYSFLRRFLNLYLEMGCGGQTETPEVPVFLNMVDGNYDVDDISQVEININEELYNYQGERYGSNEAVRNATSTVVNFVYNGTQSILFPGDATFHVLGEIAGSVFASGTQPQYMIAPHHGSCHTNFAGNMAVEDAGQPLAVLYEQINGVTTYISANHEKHAMPRREFVKIATEKSRRGVARHCLGYCDTDSKSSYRSNSLDGSRNTDAAVYNTEQLSEAGCGYFYKNLMSGEETQYRRLRQAADIRTERVPRVGRPKECCHEADAVADCAPESGRQLGPARRLPPDKLFL